MDLYVIFEHAIVCATVAGCAYVIYRALKGDF